MKNNHLLIQKVPFIIHIIRNEIHLNKHHNIKLILLQEHKYFHHLNNNVNHKFSIRMDKIYQGYVFYNFQFQFFRNVNQNHLQGIHNYQYILCIY